MNNTINTASLWEILQEALLDPDFCQVLGFTREQMEGQIRSCRLQEACPLLENALDDQGRFNAGVVLEIFRGFLPSLADEPPRGWLMDCYQTLLRKIFPETTEPEPAADAIRYQAGRRLLLQILRGLYHYEKLYCPFDPRWNIELLSAREIRQEHCTREYLRFRTLVRDLYLYEFMRLGTEVTPYNTLGHIGGVAYVAVYMARQLHRRGVPVDVALIAGAAALHDMGKYGCKKDEEKRVPYLHYYYTDVFCEREGVPQMGHIAANHSVWDLELENLSVESLLLIYADFRVKSYRDEKGREIIHFYTLREAFDVILSKLDDVDGAKRQRYQKVYVKLVDFEAYMEELGVTTDLPVDFALAPERERILPHKEKVLMEGQEVVRQLKYAAIAHNIRLMSIFRSERDFGNLIEAARSEPNWKNLRAYISIFEEYSTYMIRAKIQGIGNQEAYENAVGRLVEKLLAFTGAPAPEGGRHRIALFHASSRKTSNTLLLWSLIRQKMEDRALIREVSLRNGTVVDCRGCSYEACLHFGEQGDCFYGGVMVEEGYPAIRESDTLIFACPNYNDAVSANIMAFFNRMTALFRTDFREFAKKRIFALVVSGYSGGDIVAEQVIDALNCNKHFILPPHFVLMETANDPGSILQNEGLEQRVEEMAERIGQ